MIKNITDIINSKIYKDRDLRNDQKKFLAENGYLLLEPNKNFWEWIGAKPKDLRLIMDSILAKEGIKAGSEGKEEFTIKKSKTIEPAANRIGNLLDKNEIGAVYRHKKVKALVSPTRGEGWGLPEFHSVALGKHGVIMNAHSYKDWANDKNSVLIQPSGKKSSVDGIFFSEDRIVNQGQIFDFNEDDFLSGCEEAVKRFESNKVNHEGLKIQDDFSTGKSLDKILEIIN